MTVNAPGNPYADIGPRVGERFPDILLADQHGRQVDLHRHRDTRPALVVFYRSARW